MAEDHNLRKQIIPTLKAKESNLILRRSNTFTDETQIALGLPTFDPNANTSSLLNPSQPNVTGTKTPDPREKRVQNSPINEYDEDLGENFDLGLGIIHDVSPEVETLCSSPKPQSDANSKEKQPTMEQLFDKLEVILKFNQSMEKQMENLNANLHLTNTKVDELKSDLCSKIEDTRDELNNKIEKSNAEMKRISYQLTTRIDTLSVRQNEMEQQFYYNLENSEEKLELQIKATKEEISDNLITQINNSEAKTNKQITELQIHTDNELGLVKCDLKQYQKKVEQLEVVTKPSLSNTPIEVNVTCPNTFHNDLTLNIPKFNGRSSNPTLYLEKLKKCFMRQRDRNNQLESEEELLSDLIESSFESYATKWWHLVKYDIKQWSDFEALFLAKYWNNDVQRGVKQKIDLDRYRPDGNLSRAEYFTEKVIMLKSTSLHLTEPEIVTMLSGHFDPLIQDAIRVQNISTIRDCESLLLREDNFAVAQQMQTRSNYRNQPGGNHITPADFERRGNYFRHQTISGSRDQATTTREQHTNRLNNGNNLINRNYQHDRILNQNSQPVFKNQRFNSNNSRTMHNQYYGDQPPRGSSVEPSWRSKETRVNDSRRSPEQAELCHLIATTNQPIYEDSVTNTPLNG